MSDNQKVIISLLGAVVGHLLLFLLLAMLFTVANLLGPAPSQAAEVAPQVPEEITVMLTELLDDVELTPRELDQRYMRTDADQESAEAPENAPFHSDRNTVATSDRTPDPSSPERMPSVKGRDDLPFVEIRDREYVDGDFLDQSAASAPSPETMASPSIQAVPTLAQAESQSSSARPTPPRDPSEVPSEVEKELPADPAEQPREAPEATPENPAEADTPPDRIAEEATQPETMRLTETPMLAQRQESFDTPFPADPAIRPEEIAEKDREAEAAVEAEAPGEAAAPETPLAASARPELKQYVPMAQQQPQAAPANPSMAKAAAPDIPPPPKPPSDTPAFNSHTRAREMDGNAKNVGNTPSFDVESSALGKYKKAVTQAVERKWHRYRERHSDFVTYGTLKVKFRVDKQGKPRNLKLVKNDANAVMAEFTLRAVLDADIPEMPEEVASMLGPGGLEINYDVIVY